MLDDARTDMMNDLDRKLNNYFTGYVVRKDLVKQVSSNAAVPGYVLEYLLGQNCAADDDEAIAEGVARVKDILAQHYVERAQANAVQSDIKLKGYMRVIDKVTVILNEKRDAYEAYFENLRISHVLVDSDTVRQNRRLLVSGVWCICDLSYSPNEAKNESSFLLNKLKTIQMAFFNLDGYSVGRMAFTTDEWVDVLVRSTGLDPEQLGRRSKLFMLTRLVPYCERNYNLVELGPKGTGKSHVFSELSPHGILISGGDVTPAKLFVNNSNGRIGLVGYWDTVAFDEFAGKNKKPKGDIVDILKNYMANKSFSRGIEQVTAEASLAFVGNTSHDVGYMVRKTDLFEDLPAVYHDPAFIDRVHAYIPGWEMDTIRGNMFCTDFGFIVDYLAEALKAMRPLDLSGGWQERFELHPSLSTRDRDGVRKTYSGLMKIVFPAGGATVGEEAEILECALELRKRVKDALYRIDETFDHVQFAYREKGGAWVQIHTLEEDEWPEAYHVLDLAPEKTVTESETVAQAVPVSAPTAVSQAGSDHLQRDASVLQEGLVAYRENQRGVSYEALFGPYLGGAERIEIVDPYIRAFYQCRNLMEVMEVLLRHIDYTKASLQVHLVTAVDEWNPDKQVEYLQRIHDALEPQDIDFTWDFEEGIHARHLKVDDRWDILLDRGLDIWQKFDSNNAFALEARMPEMRRVKQFEVTYLRDSREGR